MHPLLGVCPHQCQGPVPVLHLPIYRWTRSLCALAKSHNHQSSSSWQSFSVPVLLWSPAVSPPLPCVAQAVVSADAKTLWVLQLRPQCQSPLPTGEATTDHRHREKPGLGSGALPLAFVMDKASAVLRVSAMPECLPAVGHLAWKCDHHHEYHLHTYT